jgi:alcohol dehydrogenase
VCERQTQPGFTHDGSFAEYVVVRHADVNLVRLPDTIDAISAAALGCRFATAFRAVVQQGRAAPGQWVAVYGCGGVGLSAVMIATASGARAVAVDVSPDALALAMELGAEMSINPSVVAGSTDVAESGDIAAGAARVGAMVREATGGGVSLSIDAVGSLSTCAAAVHSLARRGRHVQVGLLPPVLGIPPIPMERVIGAELEIVGSHGMAAHAYPQLLAAVEAGALRPDRLVTRRVGLDAIGLVLAEMGDDAGPSQPGITVATP